MDTISAAVARAFSNSANSYFNEVTSSSTKLNPPQFTYKVKTGCLKFTNTSLPTVVNTLRQYTKQQTSCLNACS
jgi:hypothetical protein